MKTSATAKFVGTSARKVGLVGALIRGRQAQSAATLLAHAPQRASQPVGKVLASAIANAQNNLNLKVADLRVDQVLVGPGPILKRIRPRAQGRAFSIYKRTSHITVVLSDEPADRELKTTGRIIKSENREVQNLNRKSGATKRTARRVTRTATKEKS